MDNPIGHNNPLRLGNPTFKIEYEPQKWTGKRQNCKSTLNTQYKIEASPETKSSRRRKFKKS